MEWFTVPTLVQRHAEASPQALAVSSASQQLTYADLDRRSNQLAHYLRDIGAGQGTLTGICMERSAGFPLAALAILKAGSAYLPLDPKTPAERMRQMLAAARVPVVVAQRYLGDSLRAGSWQVVELDGSPEWSSQPGNPPDVDIQPEDLAYVIYTSGSTGAPKAVQITHGSLLNLIAWHGRAFGVSAKDRATQLASIGFDAAVWELWPHLAAGASVHVVDDETRAQPEKLRDFLVREKISISFVPTPLAEQLIKLPWPERTSLRFLLTGADVLRHYPPAGLPFALVNNYGPTECTVVATSAVVPAQGHANQLPPIGRPIDNMEVHILDGNMKPVPPGQRGEIYVGGAGLSPGYLNDPEQTTASFVPHPFSSARDARLYRTGDLGSMLPDGQIAFHGRVDDQVKIRGYRIELNEVTKALLRHPAMRDSVVLARNGEGGEKRLLAYVVPRTEASVSLADLRGFLASQLPDYMLPAAFVRLEALPIGPNGKVDRAALPAPDDVNTLREGAVEEPRTPTERRIAAIVAKLLGVERVGVADNFFLLGGNSLLGTQVIAQLRAAFQVEVPLLDLFDHPTVAGLAEVVEQFMIASLDAMSEEEAQRRLAALGPAEPEL